MKLLGKITVEDFYEKEFKKNVGSFGVTQKIYEAEIQHTKDMLKPYDGEIYEFTDNEHIVEVKGLCIVDSSGTVLKKRILTRK